MSVETNNKDAIKKKINVQIRKKDSIETPLKKDENVSQNKKVRILKKAKELPDFLVGIEKVAPDPHLFNKILGLGLVLRYDIEQEDQYNDWVKVCRAEYGDKVWLEIERDWKYYDPKVSDLSDAQRDKIALDFMTTLKKKHNIVD